MFCNLENKQNLPKLTPRSTHQIPKGQILNSAPHEPRTTLELLQGYVHGQQIPINNKILHRQHRMAQNKNFTRNHFCLERRLQPD